MLVMTWKRYHAFALLLGRNCPSPIPLNEQICGVVVLWVPVVVLCSGTGWQPKSMTVEGSVLDSPHSKSTLHGPLAPLLPFTLMTIIRPSLVVEVAANNGGNSGNGGMHISPVISIEQDVSDNRKDGEHFP